MSGHQLNEVVGADKNFVCECGNRGGKCDLKESEDDLPGDFVDNLEDDSLSAFLTSAS